MRAAEQWPASESTWLEWASVMYNAAWYAIEHGDYASAISSTTVRSEQLGEENNLTLRSKALVADLYRNQGRWEEAEQLEVKVMETSWAKLSADHPSTLTSMANLASTYWNQRRWEDAEQLFVKVMEIRKAKLGADHPSTLTSMANLALAYQTQGRWEEAEQLEVKVMETSRAKLGADHPYTAVGKTRTGTHAG